jgi:hypothetical protein
MTNPDVIIFGSGMGGAKVALRPAHHLINQKDAA